MNSSVMYNVLWRKMLSELIVVTLTLLELITLTSKSWSELFLLACTNLPLSHPLLTNFHKNFKLVGSSGSNCMNYCIVVGTFSLTMQFSTKVQDILRECQIYLPQFLLKWRMKQMLSGALLVWCRELLLCALPLMVTWTVLLWACLNF